MIRKILADIGRGFMIARLASFTMLGKIVSPVAIRTSISIGVRPQTLAYVFLSTSLILDTVSELFYASEPGLDFGWGANVVLHTVVMVFIIETARNIVKQVEDGQLKPTMLFPLAFELSTLWAFLGVMSLTLALVGTAVGGGTSMGLQSVENTCDLLALGFGWTLITKPPSLWSRIKNRMRDWKPTFVPMPQGV